MTDRPGRSTTRGSTSERTRFRLAELVSSVSISSRGRFIESLILSSDSWSVMPVFSFLAIVVGSSNERLLMIQDILTN